MAVVPLKVEQPSTPSAVYVSVASIADKDYREGKNLLTVASDVFT